MSASTSPLPYTGNKSCIVNTILTVMPKHSVYIEPCMGSAEVFFRKPKAEREILNDYNGDLVNLFRTIQSNKKLVFLIGRLYLSINSELVFRQNKERLRNIPNVLDDVLDTSQIISKLKWSEVEAAVAFFENQVYTSIVLKVIYGETSFIFTGDAERTAESDILDAGYDLSATVLKVGHHGSDTSTSYPFLREVMPEYAVIQVGKDNSYGHPTEDTLSRLRDAEVKVYRNDLQGTIICTSDGKTVEFTTEKNETVQTNPTVTVTPEDDTGIEYIGNKNSKKFHLPSCANLPAEKNRVFFETRKAAVDSGFSPCGNCKP